MGGGAAMLASSAGLRRVAAQSITVPMGIWGGIMIETVKAVAESAMRAVIGTVTAQNGANVSPSTRCTGSSRRSRAASRCQPSRSA